MASGSGSSPRSDLADRYQEMVHLQVKAIVNFDNKAWRAARVIGLLIGATLTGLSLVIGKDFTAETQEIPALISLFVGFTGIVIALIFSIISYLSSHFGFGPTTKIGDRIDSSSVDVQDYQSAIVNSYTDTIKKNKQVLKAKSRRLRYTLASLLSAVIFLSIGFLLLIFNLSVVHGSLVVCLGIIVSGCTSKYIILKKYAAIDGKEETEDEEETEEG